MNATELLTWVGTVFGILTSLVVIVVGVVPVRSAHPGAGLALAGAGLVELVTECCYKGVDLYLDRVNEPVETVRVINAGLSALTISARLLDVGLIIAAAWMLSAPALPKAAR